MQDYDLERDFYGLLISFQESSFFSSLSYFVQTYIAYILLELKPNLFFCYISFLSAFVILNLSHLTDTKEDAINMPERIDHLRGRKRFILFISLILYIINVLFVFLSLPMAIPILFLPLAGNALYSLKLLPFLPRIKDIPAIKNIFVSIIWSSIIVSLVILTSLVELKNSKGIIEVASIFYFLFMKNLIAAIIFDLRDVKGDRENGIRTIPVILGNNKTNILLIAINTSLFPLLFSPLGAKWLMLLFILSGYCYILYFRGLKTSIAFNLVLDGEWIFMTIVYIIIIQLHNF